MIASSPTPPLRAAIDDWTRAPAPLPLTGGVQAYAWGQRNAGAIIPRLLGITPERDRPYAELWLGAHPLLPSTARLGDAAVSLADVITAAPAFVLGAEAAARWDGQLPFLMKVLAAERPLSIQAHPSQAQAEAGFDREEAAGIPRDAPQRMYRDRRHKPELIVALGDFFALRGFRPASEIRAHLAATPELAARFAGTPTGDERAWLKGLLGRCLDTVDSGVGGALAAVMQRLERENDLNAFPRDRIEHWMLRAARALGNGPARFDRGLLAFFLLHLVHLRDGQALFLGPGEPHAYLEGAGIEVMANSDNVVRGGLTPKPVDVPALLETLTFESGPPCILGARPDGVYPTPAAEFVTARLDLRAGETRAIAPPRGADIVLVVDGHGTIDSAEAHAGSAFLLPAGLGGYQVRAGDDAPLIAFRSSVPV